MADEINLDDGEGQTLGITSNLDPANPATEGETPEQKEAREKAEKDAAAAANPSVDWESDENPYKKRFGDSTREVNENLLPKITESQGKIAQLEREREEALAKLREEKPEAYDNLALQRSVQAATHEIATLKEKVELDSFIGANPAAAHFRAALQQHARAFPSKSLAEIWEGSGFKEVAEGREKAKTETTTRQTVTAPERGKVTADPGQSKIAGQYTEAEFNALPVEKRREILTKMEQNQ